MSCYKIIVQSETGAGIMQTLNQKQHSNSLLLMKVCVYIKSLCKATVVNKRKVRALLFGVLLKNRMHRVTPNDLLHIYLIAIGMCQNVL